MIRIPNYSDSLEPIGSPRKGLFLILKMSKGNVCDKRSKGVAHWEGRV